jgi:hypothetical protein
VAVNGKTEASIVVRCQDDVQLMVMYQDTGVTLVRGRRDPDGMIVIEAKEEIKFATNPEFVGLFFDHAWDVQNLAALTEQFCWDRRAT